MPTTVYEVRVDGLLPEQAREAFCDMRIDEVHAGTVLRGPMMDESHLFGMINQLHALGFTVVSVHPVP